MKEYSVKAYMYELHNVDQGKFVKLCVIHSRVGLLFYIPFEIVK